MTREANVCVRADGEDAAAIERAIESGGGRIVDVGRANVIVWAAPDAAAIRSILHPGIEWVQVWDAGFDGWLSTGVIDGSRIWTAAKGVYGKLIAEYCMAALFAAARSLPDVVRARQWQAPNVATLSGSTVGIVGAGGIGTELLRLLAPCDVTTLALTRSGRNVPGATEALGPDGLERLLSASDYVVLAAPLTPATDQLLNAGRLRLLRTSAWIVNVGRGRLVDTAALVTVLEQGRIGGAVLDVTDPEPLPDDHRLWQLPNVVITSHTAATADLGRAALAERVRENVQRFAAGEPLVGVVDVEASY